MEGGGNSSNMANFPQVPKSNAQASSTIETNNVVPSTPNNSTIITNNTPEVAAQSAPPAHRRTNKSGLPPLPPQDGPLRQPAHYLPTANVIRLMRRILPPQAKISDEAKETMQECVSEFISFVTEEANERCRNEQRKTITGEDLIVAMSNLGFDDYVEPLSLYLNKYREANAGQGSRARPRPIPIAAPTRMVRSPMVGPNLAYNPHPGLGFGLTQSSMKTATLAATANSIVAPTMRVRPSVMGTNPIGHNPYAGLEFGSTQGLTTTNTATATATATAATVVDPKNIGGSGNSSSFNEVGSSSSNSNDMFDFDLFDFEDAFDGTNASKDAANEAEVFDHMAKYK